MIDIIELDLIITDVKKKLILEFIEKLKKYLGCGTCVSNGKPKTCKSCCELYSMIKEYDEKLK